MEHKIISLPSEKFEGQFEKRVDEYPLFAEVVESYKRGEIKDDPEGWMAYYMDEETRKNKQPIWSPVSQFINLMKLNEEVRIKEAQAFWSPSNFSPKDIRGMDEMVIKEQLSKAVLSNESEHFITLRNAYNECIIGKDLLLHALQHGEITLYEYVKILNYGQKTL